ncbi:hypothetical protein NQ317_014064 [Molorchus minor]|uniref:Uncharacterized protein n=1 Tax=Molorchus minor TaxID=1323400 RepID=A0ABQ9JFX4_9CUCU|nr:hypothetical protein NQ317_014064 [Molorchus minor]
MNVLSTHPSVTANDCYPPYLFNTSRSPPASIKNSDDWRTNVQNSDFRGGSRERMGPGDLDPQSAPQIIYFFFTLAADGDGPPAEEASSPPGNATAPVLEQLARKYVLAICHKSFSKCGWFFLQILRSGFTTKRLDFIIVYNTITSDT